MGKTKIFVDMDGVLAGFDVGARKLIEKLGLPQPPKDALDLFPGNTYKKARDYITKNPDFWLDLPPNKDAVEAFKFSHEDTYVLSSPSWDGSASPKIAWCKKHLGIDTDRIILTSNKALLADKDSILVDDQLKFCNPFAEAGGHALLVERPWSFSKDDGYDAHENVTVIKLASLPYILADLPF